jgi:hypothetical protein
VVPVLAEAGATTFPQLVTPLLGATVAAVVLWLVALLVVAFATRPRDIDPGPATMDLGEEPPAVVDLLTNDWRVTADAIPATLLDLAARDFVDLEQYGPGRTVCRIRRAAADGLETYERMVLDHVAGLAVDGIVPAEALTTGPQDQSTRWWRAFQRRVVRDARERGLTRDRWSSPVKALLRLAALVPAGLGVLLANAAGGLDLGTIGVGLVIWALLTSSMKLVGDQRDTPAGAEAAARWLGVRSYLGRNEVFPTLPPASVAVWDRYLGYGAALGVATAALQALPMGAEDDHRAWSAYGGRWRMVKVRYPRLSFIWGRKPAIAILVGLAVAGAGYGVLRLMLGLRDWADGFTEADQAAGWVQAAAAVLAVTAVLVAAWGCGRCCGRSSTSSPGRRSKARWCADGPTAGGTTGPITTSASTPVGWTRSRRGWSRRACTTASRRAASSRRPSVRGSGTCSRSPWSAVLERQLLLSRPWWRRRRCLPCPGPTGAWARRRSGRLGWTACWPTPGSRSTRPRW